MIWASLQTKLVAVGGAIIATLMVALKMLSASRKRAIQEARRAKAALSRQKDIEGADNELDKQGYSRRAEIKKEIKEGKSVKSLEDPNDF